MLFCNITVTILTGFILLFSGHWHISNFGNIFQSTLDSVYGIPGWVIGMALLITPYFGFETVPQMVEEGDFPIKDSNKAILGSIVSCGIVYSLFFFGLGGMPVQSLVEEGGAAVNGFLAITMMEQLGGGWSVFAVIFGIAAITSNVSSGQVANKTGIRMLPLIYIIQTVCLLLLPIATHNLISGGLVLFILGVMMYLLNSPLQMHFLNIATREHPACVNLASSLISVFFNFGIAAGSAMGGVIVKYAGLRFVGIGGAVPGIGAIICAVILLQIMKPGADIR